ncbi:hypothetical protein CcarbDRAFT_1920 [Clostridium carboxidivorans P7]|uniref:Uncharacterized protein n=1 Tax=Clostridium carboxidivorans P7 TaxID=536227 RepID=C6PT03_9CLOT|nr:hypothetical protein CcarbDRAFT_1920 [Clostridium carboxidivorans P7]
MRNLLKEAVYKQIKEMSDDGETIIYENQRKK